MSIRDYFVLAFGLTVFGLIAIVFVNGVRELESGFFKPFLPVVAAFLAFGTWLVAGTSLYKDLDEQAAMQKCLTAHERRAKAEAAPNDYFGKQLRDAAAVEAKTCADLADDEEDEQQSPMRKGRTPRKR
jgi:hypothetical protein